MRELYNEEDIKLAFDRGEQLYYFDDWTKNYSEIDDLDEILEMFENGESIHSH